MIVPVVIIGPITVVPVMVIAVVIVPVVIVAMMIVVGRSGCRHEGRGQCTEQCVPSRIRALKTIQRTAHCVVSNFHQRQAARGETCNLMCNLFRILAN